MNDDAVVEAIAHWLGLIGAVLAFLASWIYCVTEYGYLLGFGLGWLPSIILAAIIFAVIRYLWWLLALGALAIALIAYSSF